MVVADGQGEMIYMNWSLEIAAVVCEYNAGESQSRPQTDSIWSTRDIGGHLRARK